MVAEGLIEAFEESVRETEGAVSRGLQHLVSGLLSQHELLLIHLHRLVVILHLHQHVADVAQRPKLALQVLHHMRQCCGEGGSVRLEKPHVGGRRETFRAEWRECREEMYIWSSGREDR